MDMQIEAGRQAAPRKENKMRIIVFVVLKVIELAAVVFVPYWTGRLVRPPLEKLEGDFEAMPYWVCGCLSILVISIIIFLACVFGIANWDWAGQLLGK